MPKRNVLSSRETRKAKKCRAGYTLSRSISRRQRGGALVMATVYVTIFAMVVAYVMLASNRQTRNTHRSRLFTTSLAAAATIVKSMTQQAYFVATTRPAQLEGRFSKLDEAILSIQPKQLPGYTSAKDGDHDLTFLKAKGSNNGEQTEITDPDDDWAGFKIRRWSYDAVAFLNAAYDPNNPDAVLTDEIDPTAKHLGFQGAGFKTGIEINYIPLYQYAIFYDNDLELHTGPEINVMGPVHSNKTMWLATQQTLTFNSKVTAAGDLRSYRDFVGDVSGSEVPLENSLLALGKDGRAGTTDDWLEINSHAGTVRVKSKSNNSLTDLNKGVSDELDTNNNSYLDSLDDNWMVNALERFGGNLQDSAMGVKPIKPPLPYVETPDGERAQAEAGDLIQRANANDTASMKEHKMEYMADYVIEGDPSSVKVVEDVDGNKYTVPTDNALSITQGPGKPIKNYETNNKGKLTGPPLVTAGAFHDNRQKALVNSFDINMGEVIDRGLDFSSGLLYVSADGGEMASVRITNAEEVPTNARNTFTIASDRPMYLEGDVNAGDDRAALLLAADAITVTSQRLTETNTDESRSGYKMLKASPTETNAIFMLGQVSSKYKDEASGEILDHHADGAKRIQMSGGAHNVLRYLENWSGITHTYYGSLICLFESRIATGDFWRKDTNKSGNLVHKSYYNAPSRSYNWDPNLADSEPPTGMPVLVEVKVSRLERISRSEAVAALPN